MNGSEKVKSLSKGNSQPNYKKKKKKRRKNMSASAGVLSDASSHLQLHLRYVSD